MITDTLHDPKLLAETGRWTIFSLSPNYLPNWPLHNLNNYATKCNHNGLVPLAFDLRYGDPSSRWVGEWLSALMSFGISVCNIMLAPEWSRHVWRCRTAATLT